jgi:hypothetical protein
MVSLCHESRSPAKKKKKIQIRTGFFFARLDFQVNTSSDGGEKLHGKRGKKFFHHPSLIFLSCLSGDVL